MNSNVSLRHNSSGSTDRISSSLASAHQHWLDGRSDLPFRPIVARRPPRSQARSRVVDHAGAAQEVVGSQPGGPASRATGRQHVRRAGHIVSHGHRTVVPQKRSPGVANLSPVQAAAFSVAMCRCSGAIASVSATGFVGSRAPESTCRTVPGSVASGRCATGRHTCRSSSPEVALIISGLQVNRMEAPGECSA